jgi:hypothetical protein
MLTLEGCGNITERFEGDPEAAWGARTNGGANQSGANSSNWLRRCEDIARNLPAF